MQEAPASGAPPCVARTEIVTMAWSEIGLTGEALAASPNGPPLDDAAGGGTWGLGAGGATAARCGCWAACCACWSAGEVGGLFACTVGGGGIGSRVGLPTGCCEGDSSRGFGSAAGAGGGAAACGCAGADGGASCATAPGTGVGKPGSRSPSGAGAV